jgi:hypothetical protein
LDHPAGIAIAPVLRSSIINYQGVGMARQSQTQQGQRQEQSQPGSQEQQSQPGLRPIPDRNLPGEPRREGHPEDEESRDRGDVDADIERGPGPERQTRDETYTTF